MIFARYKVTMTRNNKKTFYCIKELLHWAKRSERLLQLMKHHPLHWRPRSCFKIWRCFLGSANSNVFFQTGVSKVRKTQVYESAEKGWLSGQWNRECSALRLLHSARTIRRKFSLPRAKDWSIQKPEGRRKFK